MNQMNTMKPIRYFRRQAFKINGNFFWSFRNNLPAFIFFAAFCLQSCGKGNDAVKEEKTVSAPEQAAGENTKATPVNPDWIESFREFRMALYHHNKEKTKQYVTLPFMSENNEIWHVIGDTTHKTDPLSDAIIPFTEKDFLQHFDTVFPKHFMQAMLKIKSEELLKKGKFATPELRDDSTEFSIYAEFNAAEKTLMLTLQETYKLPEEDFGSSLTYQFEIQENGQLKLKQLNGAG